MSKQSFINLLKDDAIKGYKEYKILPSLTIAQAILETGWGKHSIGNNIFGIKANKYWTGKKKLVRTHEYVNGRKIYVNAWFRDYDSIYESLKDRYKFLQKPRYSKIVGEKDYKKACYEIQKAGYATDPNYPKKLIRIIEQNKLQEIDRIAFESAKNKNDEKKTSQDASQWARKSWEWSRLAGFMDGNRPKDNLTREEFAIIIKRMVDSNERYG